MAATIDDAVYTSVLQLQRVYNEIDLILCEKIEFIYGSRLKFQAVKPIDQRLYKDFPLGFYFVMLNQRPDVCHLFGKRVFYNKEKELELVKNRFCFYDKRFELFDLDNDLDDM